MIQRDKKSEQRNAGELVKRLRAQARRASLADEVMPEYLAEDPVARSEFLKRSKREERRTKKQQRRMRRTPDSDPRVSGNS